MSVLRIMHTWISVVAMLHFMHTWILCNQIKFHLLKLKILSIAKLFWYLYLSLYSIKQLACIKFIHHISKSQIQFVIIIVTYGATILLQYILFFQYRCARSHNYKRSFLQIPSHMHMHMCFLRLTAKGKIKFNVNISNTCFELRLSTIYL